MHLDFTEENFFWINEPEAKAIDHAEVQITTAPETDLWSKTYYGFEYSNAPMYLTRLEASYFTFTVKCRFNYIHPFDQCGLVLYLGPNNWMKASAELEGESLQLGSVVTNFGYSDWSSREVSVAIEEIWFRLSRREEDFLIEYSFDGEIFTKHRIFHMHKLREVSVPTVGLYAASPSEEGSFTASFTELTVGECLWTLE